MNILVLFGHGNKPGLLRMLRGIETGLEPKGHSFFHAIDFENDFFAKQGFDDGRIFRIKGLKRGNSFFRRLFGIDGQRHLLSYCKDRGIDLILSYTLSTLPLAVKVSEKTGIPCAVWLHNDYPDAGKRYKKCLLDRCNAIIAVSDFIMQGVREYLGKTEKKLFVAYNAIDIKDFIEQADRLDLPKELPKVSDEEIVIGMIAAMDRNKNPQLLLRAIARVKEALPGKKVRVLLAGRFPDPEYEKETRALAEELGINGQVVFMGFQSNVSSIYREMDILVHPTFREAFCLVAIEAMVWGKPVIASKTGGIPEIVEDGVTGILCEPGDIGEFAEAIQKLVIDNDLREKMGCKGKERVYKMFSMERLAADVEQVFNKIIKKPLNTNLGKKERLKVLVLWKLIVNNKKLFNW